jgi:hypothetical protein
MTMAYCKANQLDCNGFCNRFDAPCIKKNCRFFGVKTNADRIRAMSDEELASLLFRANFVGRQHDYRAIVMEWLQQPAEGD